jgi:hypothetical protein
MKDFVVHKNEFDKLKDTKPRKQKWLQFTPLEGPMYKNFGCKDEVQKTTKMVDKRLKLSGLSTAILDEKYFGVDVMYMHLGDLEGMSLWSNDTLKQTLGFNPAGKALREYVTEKFGDSIPVYFSEYQKINENLPDVAEFQFEFFHFGIPALFKCRYERVDTLKGTPFAYMVFIRYYPQKEVEQMKKRHTKAEIVEQKFLDFGLEMEKVIEPYKKLSIPVLCLNLIGRLLWMNKSFENHFQKGEKDLLEIFAPQYGFEAYEKGVEAVLRTFPRHYEIKALTFDRIDGANTKSVGYFVTFHDVDMNLTDKSKVERCDDILRKVGLSKSILDTKWDEVNREVLVIGIDGRLLYQNVFHKQSHKSSDEVLDMLVIKMVREMNPHTTDVFDTLLKNNLPTEYICVTEIKFENPTRYLTVKLSYERIDTEDGSPFAYYSFIDFLN